MGVKSDKENTFWRIKPHINKSTVTLKTNITWKFNFKARGLILINLNLEGCKRSMQYQLGILKPSQHLLEDGKTKKTVSSWPVAGSSGAHCLTAGSPANKRLPQVPLSRNVLESFILLLIFLLHWLYGPWRTLASVKINLQAF